MPSGEPDGVGATTSFLYDGDSVLLEQQGGATTASYAYGSALLRKDGETPLFDGQGSERTVTNSSEAVQGTLTLSAFGQAVASSGSSADPYQYAATSRYRSDGDAGLSLVGCRYYDLATGSFLTRDTDLSQSPYAYCDADPVNYVDPDGHSPAPDGHFPLPPFLKDILKGLGGDPTIDLQIQMPTTTRTRTQTKYNRDRYTFTRTPKGTSIIFQKDDGSTTSTTTTITTGGGSLKVGL